MSMKISKLLWIIGQNDPTHTTGNNGQSYRSRLRFEPNLPACVDQFHRAIAPASWDETIRAQKCNLDELYEGFDIVHTHHPIDACTSFTRVRSRNKETSTAENILLPSSPHTHSSERRNAPRVVIERSVSFVHIYPNAPVDQLQHAHQQPYHQAAECTRLQHRQNHVYDLTEGQRGYHLALHQFTPATFGLDEVPPVVSEARRLMTWAVTRNTP